ncbi:hypothetical protein ACQKWADRAFT_313970 [Trichoderma austrokoningii]
MGLALYDSPDRQLSWLAGKFIISSISLATNNEVLKHVSMCYLTQIFDSAAFIYAQNPTGKYFSNIY